MPIHTVMVTGAAGSIGSEVCRVLVERGIDVIGYDIAETPLFWLNEELGKTGNFTPVLGSVTSSHHLYQTIGLHEPQVIVHAAALKHVGMCERNICEAVLTNVQGTVNVATAAKGAAARMVLVSTDKAVAPSSIMGMTKRVAELYCADLSDARIVRLVNIRESNGSLLQLIRTQVEAGGPVTITDKRMKRFFMDIGEAADMIVTQALDGRIEGSALVVPSGVAQESILHIIQREVARYANPPPIVEIGMRPGEKLQEALMYDTERYGTRRVRSAGPFWRSSVRRLVRTAAAGHAAEARYSLTKLAKDS